MDNDKFAKEIRKLLISENGYVTDCGSTKNVNEVVLNTLKEQIKKHPHLWKIFFMVA